MSPQVSPLSQLPAQLERRQMLFLDAIRFSVEMIMIAYTRLSTTLLSASCLHLEREPNWQLPHGLFGNALLDAWSIIDSSVRLAELLKQIPRSKKNVAALEKSNDTSVDSDYVLELGKMPEVRNFLNCDTVRYANTLRNHFHHLHQDINEQKGIHNPVLGRISWITFVHTSKPTIRAYILIPGVVFPSKHRAINPLGLSINYPIDLITIESHEVILSLSTLAKDADNLRKSFETTIQDALHKEPFATCIAKGNTAGSDTLLSMDCEFEESPEQPWPFAPK